MTGFDTTDPPRDIRVDRDNRKIYSTLTEDDSSPFYDAQLKDVFVFAASYGFNQGLRLKLGGDTQALANRESLSDSQRWIIKSIALKEVEDSDILMDGRQIYTIAEEYANGGIEQLQKVNERPGDFYKTISTELIELDLD